uniref:F-box domain-containing protein n=1 Tax=Ditylenchus dipsaci TaxID=166011 RepID=A0A915E9J5_9BILA
MTIRNLPLLLEVLRFCSRDQLDVNISLTCHLFNQLVKEHFKERPLRILKKHDLRYYYLEIYLNEKHEILLRLLNLSAPGHPSPSMDPRNLKWADDTPAFPINYWLPLLLSKHLRIRSTTIYMGPSVYTADETAQLEGICHLWTGRNLRFSHEFFKKNISVAANSIENLLNNNRLISCQNLVLDLFLEGRKLLRLKV